MDLTQIKERFGIIGNDPGLERAIEVAQRVASSDVSVLVTGESGVGKEVIPQIIHSESPRKHGKYIAVNCGAIPEGTIDSELFGHEKGSFTGATEARKGYFEEADGGTLFLDEVAELPVSTQVRLLRVLQSGEFIKVGSSKVQKTDVRVIAATNVNLEGAIASGRFRSDLFYRLNTVPITVPPLRERKGDIHLLFKKFASDFADRYMTPTIRLDQDAVQILESYRWPGNIRQLKSIAEQISMLEEDKRISAATLLKYIPVEQKLPAVAGEGWCSADYQADRDLIFKALYSLRQEVEDLRTKLDNGSSVPRIESASPQRPSIIIDEEEVKTIVRQEEEAYREEHEAQETLSIKDVNAEIIRKALEKHGGNRKEAAQDLGISERTLYRKIKNLIILVVAILGLSGCGVYSFSGTSIQEDVKTICIENVENKALKVNPSLANMLFEEMCDKYKRLTRLEQVEDNADLYVYATIESYQVNAVAITADEVAAMSRLTVTVKVRFTNEKHPEDNFEKSFAAYEDYNSENSLDSVEGTLCETIVEKIVEDIFNATVANW